MTQQSSVPNIRPVTRQRVKPLYPLLELVRFGSRKLASGLKGCALLLLIILTDLTRPCEKLEYNSNQVNMGGGATSGGGFDVILANQQNQGWRGLFRNGRCLGLAMFASLGGVLYGYAWVLRYTFNGR